VEAHQNISLHSHNNSIEEAASEGAGHHGPYLSVAMTSP